MEPTNELNSNLVSLSQWSGHVRGGGVGLKVELGVHDAVVLKQARDAPSANLKDDNLFLS